MRLKPALPASWNKVVLRYVHQTRTPYEIRFENPHHLKERSLQVELDGTVIEEGEILLSNDGATHHIPRPLH